jgi:hypothetical protein
MTGSCENTWRIRSPSTGGMPSGGLLLRLGWKRAEEESSTEPAEGLRMFRVFVSCGDRFDRSPWLMLLCSKSRRFAMTDVVANAVASVVTNVVVRSVVLSRPHLR